jgi:hypothetical protein
MRVPSGNLKTNYFRMKTTKIKILSAFTLLLLGTSSCIEELFIEGNGMARTEIRDDEGFNEISSSGDFEIHVSPGTSYSVEITAESNLLPYISTNVDGKKLKIKTTGAHSLRQTLPIEIYITTPTLKGLALSGSGFIKTGSFMSDKFDITLSGSGDIITDISCDELNSGVSGSGSITATGDALRSKLFISGSGKIKLYNLEQDDCEAVISGSGDVFVNASRTLDARISGSGRVYYVNHPTITTSISGSGAVVNKN